MSFLLSLKHYSVMYQKKDYRLRLCNLVKQNVESFRALGNIYLSIMEHSQGIKFLQHHHRIVMQTLLQKKGCIYFRLYYIKRSCFFPKAFWPYSLSPVFFRLFFFTRVKKLRKFCSALSFFLTPFFKVRPQRNLFFLRCILALEYYIAKTPFWKSNGARSYFSK